MEQDVLLAKSVPAGTSRTEAYTLLGHGAAVANTGVELAVAIGSSVLDKFGILDREAELRIVLRYFGWLHDIGKANEQFGKLVKTGNSVQMLRHEVISALLLQRYPPLKAKLAVLEPDVRYALMCAVLGHHRKFPAPHEDQIRETLDTWIRVDHPECRDLWERLEGDIPDSQTGNAAILPIKLTLHPTSDKSDAVWNGGDVLNGLIDELEERLEEGISVPFRRFVAVSKALAIAADVLASALPDVGNNEKTRSKFIGQLRDTGMSSRAIQQLVNQWADSRGISPFRPRPFQQAVAASDSMLTLAEAGCGSGKSIAAYLWAYQWAGRYENAGNPAPRLIFCLPTMGTATEQYKDYAMEADVDARLVHSKADLDLAAMHVGIGQEEEGRDRVRHQEEAIEAFRLWGMPMAVCTADTVLGMMVNARKAIYAFPAIMNSIIVFDEIHAMDHRMFRHLLAFLEHTPKLPVLLMSASLSESRKKLLARARGGGMMAVADDQSGLAELPRYRLELFPSDNKLKETLEQTLQENGHVLWVCNQVESANRCYRAMKERYERDGVIVEVYHSRFRYKDRSRRHRQALDIFSKHAGPVILVTTQVAEMSLDLSADLLITELAPTPSLIQRLGRLNRRATPANPLSPKICCILRPAGEKPYERSDLKTAEYWAEELQNLNRPLSQKDLAEWFLRMQPEEEDLEGMWKKANTEAWFLSGVWETPVDRLRDAGLTRNVVLEADVAAFKQANGGLSPDRRWISEHEVPLVHRDEMFQWPIVNGVPIAPGNRVRYNFDEISGKGEGASWAD